MTTQTLLPSQYCHKVMYSGHLPNRKIGHRTRMTIRVDQDSDFSFIVTKAVCSSTDQFRKATGRATADQRMRIHHSCLANSKNYGPYAPECGIYRAKGLDHIERYSKIDTMVEYQCFHHIDPSRNSHNRVAYVFKFKSDCGLSPKDMVDTIYNMFDDPNHGTSSLVYSFKYY